MQVPVDVLIKGVSNKKPIEKIIQEKVAKLEKVSDRITSCRVVVEHSSDPQKKSKMDHVLIEVKIPPHHDIIVKKDATNHQNLPTLVREAFIAARRQVTDLEDKRHNHKAADAKEEVLDELKEKASAE